MSAMNKFKAASVCVHFIWVGLVVIAGTGCGDQPAKPATPTEPVVTFKPKEMADALHAVIAADQETYFRHETDEKDLAMHARLLRQASESIQQGGAEFHYVLRSLWPINPKAGPETDTEKAGLQYVLDHPGTNFYSGESLGGRRYFTAVYADMAASESCVGCHNRNPDSPRKDFKPGDVIGGLVVRVPLEF
jgi:hypothetical protein